MNQGVINEMIDMMKELNEMVKILNNCIKDLDKRVSTMENTLIGSEEEISDIEHSEHSKYYWDLDRNL